MTRIPIRPPPHFFFQISILRRSYVIYFFCLQYLLYFLLAAAAVQCTRSGDTTGEGFALNNFLYLLIQAHCGLPCRRRRDRLDRRQRLASQPEMAVPRLQPITHREGSPTLAPAIQVPIFEFIPEEPAMSTVALAQAPHSDSHEVMHTQTFVLNASEDCVTRLCVCGCGSLCVHPCGLSACVLPFRVLAFCLSRCLRSAFPGAYVLPFQVLETDVLCM
jgi:hypothetical protein